MTTVEPKNQLAVVARSENTSRGDRLVLVSRALDVDLLRQRFEEFMSKLQSIVYSDAGQAGPFRLEEIEFSAEITADGDFKLMGTGIGVEAKSGVVFTLRRRAPEATDQARGDAQS